MTIPGTARDIIKSLTRKYGFSISRIALEIDISRKTIYEILNGSKPLSEIDIRLLLLYLKIQFRAKKKTRGEKTRKFILDKKFIDRVTNNQFKFKNIIP